MKKILVVITALVLSILWMVSTESVAAEKKIAVIWEGKSGMTKRIHMGFVRRMKTIAPNVEIVTKREIDGMPEAEKLFREFEATMDGIVFLRSSGVEFLARANPKVPSFVGGCNNPLYLGAIKNLNAPEGKITGVTYFIPYETRFQVIRTLFPAIKSVCLLAQKGHPATPIEQMGTRDQCERFGIKYNEVVAEKAKELIEGAEKFGGAVDLFIITNTALVMDNTVGLVGVANRSKTPLFSFAEGRAKLGAVAELAADDEKLGAMLADSVVDVVVHGKPISQVPVKMDPDPAIIINQGIMQSMGLKFPDKILEKAELVK